MKIVRWVVSIIIPLSVLVLFLILYRIEEVNILSDVRNPYLRRVFHSLVMILALSVYSILGCLLAPTPKKHVVLVNAILMFLISTFVLIYPLIEYGIKGFSILPIIGSAGLFIGTGGGVIISYWIFINKGWSQQSPKSEVADSY